MEAFKENIINYLPFAFVDLLKKPLGDHVGCTNMHMNLPFLLLKKRKSILGYIKKNFRSNFV